MLISYPLYLQKGPLDLIETGKGLKVQTDKPHLVSLGSGRLSTAITLLPLEEGKHGQGAPHPHHYRHFVLEAIPLHVLGALLPLPAVLALSQQCFPRRARLLW